MEQSMYQHNQDDTQDICELSVQFQVQSWRSFLDGQLERTPNTKMLQILLQKDREEK